ncbi:MAG: cation-transporting P-type ATPase, partial [Ectothiorhodospiraceae bacterium]
MATVRLSAAVWSLSADTAAGEIGVDPERGLDDSEVRRRRRQFGRNQLRRTAVRSAWDILVDQLKGLMVIFLATAAGLSFAFRDWVEGGAIVAVIVINTLIGFATELRAVRSMEALRKLGGSRARVRRNGRVREIPADELVPGDVVLVEGGDVIAADMRLLEASRLTADESALTGESLPAEKTVDAVDTDAPLAERRCLLFKGTAVTR